MMTALRASLGCLVALGFVVRMVAIPVSGGCAPAQAGGHHQQDHRHHGSDLPACVCIAHISSAAPVGEPVRLVARAAQPATGDSPATHRTIPQSSSAHVLPFPIGPPAAA